VVFACPFSGTMEELGRLLRPQAMTYSLKSARWLLVPLERRTLNQFRSYEVLGGGDPRILIVYQLKSKGNIQKVSGPLGGKGSQESPKHCFWRRVAGPIRRGEERPALERRPTSSQRAQIGSIASKLLHWRDWDRQQEFPAN